MPLPRNIKFTHVKPWLAYPEYTTHDDLTSFQLAPGLCLTFQFECSALTFIFISRSVLSEPDGVGRLRHGDERDLRQEHRQPGPEARHAGQALQGGAVNCDEIKKTVSWGANLVHPLAA